MKLTWEPIYLYYLDSNGHDFTSYCIHKWHQYYGRGMGVLQKLILTDMGEGGGPECPKIDWHHLWTAAYILIKLIWILLEEYWLNSYINVYQYNVVKQNNHIYIQPAQDQVHTQLLPHRLINSWLHYNFTLILPDPLVSLLLPLLLFWPFTDHVVDPLPVSLQTGVTAVELGQAPISLSISKQ